RDRSFAGDDAMPAPGIEQHYHQHLNGRFTPLAELPSIRTWACLRTFTDDKRPLIGWDPQLPWLFWVAGLGGSGIGISAPVGELAANLLLERPTQNKRLLAAVDPARLSPK